MGHQTGLVVSFLAMISCVCLVQGVIELSRGEAPQVLDLLRQRPSVATLRAVESELDRVSWFASTLRPWMQFARFLVFRDTGEKVLIGRSGWWFYRPGIQYLLGPPAVDEENHAGRDAAVSAIVGFRDQLTERGVRLLVVPIPGKASVYPDKLTGRAATADSRVHVNTASVIAGLKEAGIEVTDLFATFRSARELGSSAGSEPFYLKRDTHWSNRGVRLAARTVAERILELGWAEKGDVRYEAKHVVVERRGDLLTMLQTPPIEALFEAEEVVCEQVIDPRTRQPYQDSPESSILVLGDSFLRIYEQDEPGAAGFVAQLARALDQPVTSIVNDGGASTLVRQALARRPGLLVGKKLVVWEFVERDIRFGIEGWQDVPLPAGPRVAAR